MTPAAPDFLSSVAAKAVGMLPLVEPRLRSRFETGAENAGVLGSESGAPVDCVEEVESGWAASSLRNTIARPAGQPGPRESAERDALPEIAPPRRPPAEQSQSIEAREVTEPVEPVAVIATPANPQRKSAPVPATAEPVADLLPVPAPRREARPANDRPALRARALMPVTPPSRPDPQAGRQQLVVRNETTIHTAPPAVLAPPKPPAPPLPARVPEIVPRLGRRGRDVVDCTPPLAPIINITIGRVDVRAHVAAPTTPPRLQPRQRETPQSLADYLGRRDSAR